jgi:ATP-dependent DNA helicase DinG
MAEAVEEAIRERRSLMIEAGTGTGKTLAYLVPAILSGKRVIVSTATRNLQEQLFHKDIPLLDDVLEVPFSAVLLKGRSNYLCLDQLAALRDRPPVAGAPEVEDFLQIDRWADETETGDRAELEDIPEDARIWHDVTSTPERCGGTQCPHYEDCFVVHARRKAMNADLLIVNHHLFFADLALKEIWDAALIPDPDVVIFDEAHGLEDVACQFFAVQVSNWRIRELAHDVRRALSKTRQLEALDRRMLDRTLSSCDAFFQTFEGFPPGRTRMAENNLPPESETRLADLRLDLDAVEGLCARKGVPGDPISPLTTRAAMLRDALDDLLFLDDPDRVHCVERRGRGTFLQAIPIRMADIFRDTLFNHPRTHVFTSATLTTDASDWDGFAHFRDRMGAGADVLTQVVASPFDYANQVTLHLPSHLPMPNDPSFAEAAADEIEAILHVTEGRAFVLFTSYRMLDRCHQLLAERLPFTIFRQGEAPRDVLIRRFRETANPVLFATSSFWEGVDVAGEALSCVIMDRLPFQSPGDPLVQARLDLLRSEERDPFSEFQVPTAILALKQGFGRLIRNRSDRGVVAILDKRIQTAGYGRRFLNALPPVPQTTTLEELAHSWRSDRMSEVA